MGANVTRTVTSSGGLGSAARPRAIQGPSSVSDSALSEQIPRAGASPSEGITSHERSPPLPFTRYAPDGVRSTESPSALRQRTASSTLFKGTEKAQRKLGASSGLPGASAAATSSEPERTMGLSLISVSMRERALVESLKSRSIELAVLSTSLNRATNMSVGGRCADDRAGLGSGAAAGAGGAAGAGDGAAAGAGGAPPHAN